MKYWWLKCLCKADKKKDKRKTKGKGGNQEVHTEKESKSQGRPHYSLTLVTLILSKLLQDMDGHFRLSHGWKHIHVESTGPLF